MTFAKQLRKKLFCTVLFFVQNTAKYIGTEWRGIFSEDCVVSWLFSWQAANEREKEPIFRISDGLLSI